MIMVFGASLIPYNSRQASVFAAFIPQSSRCLLFSLFFSLIQTSSALPLVPGSVLVQPRQDAAADDQDKSTAADSADFKPVSVADKYLPAQIGGIVGSYAVSLVLVAAALLILSKRRREHLQSAENEVEFFEHAKQAQLAAAHAQAGVNGYPPADEYPEQWKEQLEIQQEQLHQHLPHHYPPHVDELQVPASPVSLTRSIPRSPVALGIDRDYSPNAQQAPPDIWPTHPRHLSGGLSIRTTATHQTQKTYQTHQTQGSTSRSHYIIPSPSSTTRSPLGYDDSVDQTVVQKDKEMAQSQLEEMYKHAFEHEEAKLKGVDAPPIPMNRAPVMQSPASLARPSTAGTTTSKRAKPAALNLSASKEPEKHKSRTSSLFSALLSPKKNKTPPMSISSPIMTPMSGTFPRESQEMNTIPPRQYAPAGPPPIPGQPAYRQKPAPYHPLTPEYSPADATMSIDQRMASLNAPIQTHSRNESSDSANPSSAKTDDSSTPLVGLPSSPKPGQQRFPSLPASPRPGQQSFNLPASPRANQQSFPPLPSPRSGSSFSRPNAPSAVRTGGALPLRAYEPALASPSASSTQTKQTTFERAPLSPRGGAMSPYTGTAMPYSPYQPFSPCVPVTPSLVTKADRKRMKRLEPKTPTMTMVQSNEDLW